MGPLRNVRDCLLGIAGVALMSVALTSSVPAGRADETDLSHRRERFQRELASTNPADRLGAVGQIERSAEAGLLPLLLGTMHDPDSGVRAATAWGLSAFPGPRSLEAARGALGDTNDRVRAAAIWSVSKLGGRGAGGEVARLAREDPSGLVRFRAVWGLINVGDPALLPVAVAALTDANIAVRQRAAVLAIGRLADRTLTPQLLALRAHSQPDTRRLVMYLLGRYGDASSDAALLDGANDADPLVRGEAALSLGKRRVTSAHPVLARLLDDTDEHVRGSAAHALGLLGEAAARGPLRAHLQDESPFVRAVAAESLQRLGETSVHPPDGFRAAELFTFPIASPEHQELYQ